MPLDLTHVAALVSADLKAMNAATADQLVSGAPARALVMAQSFTLPYSQDKTLMVVVGLAPGAPGQLPVPTQLEHMRYTVAFADDQSLSITARPSRGYLITAATRALADEGRAIAAAEAALVRAKVSLPPNAKTWKAALRSATYDSRLPAGQFAGAPSWNFIFEPWSDDRGWNQVLLDSGLGVTSVNGKPPS